MEVHVAIQREKGQRAQIASTSASNMVNLLSANTFTDVAALFLTEALIYMGFLLILNVLSASISGYNYANTEGITKEDIVSLVRLCQDKSRLAWNHTTQTVLEFTKKFLESLYTLCDQMSYVLEVLTKTRPIKVSKYSTTLLMPHC